MTTADPQADLKTAEPKCPQCGGKLLLKDELQPMGTKDGLLDEWECPRCLSGVYIDPTGHSEKPADR